MGNRSRIEILHEEEDFVVINKPAGLLSIPDRFDQGLPNAKHILREQYGEILTVHRLDRDTSGVLCFARTPEAHSHLSTQFADHQPKKIYWALVAGTPLLEEGSIDTALTEDLRRPGRMTTTVKGGLNALTHYRVIEKFADYSLLEVQIETGRTHQIRVHLQSIGHALVADPFYSRQSSFFLSAVKGRKYRLGKNKEERPLLSRTALHAHSLEFIHPSSGATLQFEAELPKDMRATLQQLQKWNALN